MFRTLFDSFHSISLYRDDNNGKRLDSSLICYVALPFKEISQNKHFLPPRKCAIFSTALRAALLIGKCNMLLHSFVVEYSTFPPPENPRCRKNGKVFSIFLFFLFFHCNIFNFRCENRKMHGGHHGLRFFFLPLPSQMFIRLLFYSLPGLLPSFLCQTAPAGFRK